MNSLQVEDGSMTVDHDFLQHSSSLSTYFLAENNIDLDFLTSIVGELECHVTVQNNYSILMRTPSGTDHYRVVVLTERVLDKYKNGIKSCPNCEKVGDISTEFGWRNCAGTVRPQSWCTSCRSLKP